MASVPTTTTSTVPRSISYLIVLHNSESKQKKTFAYLFFCLERNHVDSLSYEIGWVTWLSHRMQHKYYYWCRCDWSSVRLIRHTMTIMNFSSPIVFTISKRYCADRHTVFNNISSLSDITFAAQEIFFSFPFWCNLYFTVLCVFSYLLFSSLV